MYLQGASSVERRPVPCKFYTAKRSTTMKVIGLRKSSFKGKDGSQVSGVNLYLTEKCENGEGQSCERVYVTDQRLTACGYTPKLGDEVTLEYNRWGKCSGVHLTKI